MYVLVWSNLTDCSSHLNSPKEFYMTKFQLALTVEMKLLYTDEVICFASEHSVSGSTEGAILGLPKHRLGLTWWYFYFTAPEEVGSLVDKVWWFTLLKTLLQNQTLAFFRIQVHYYSNLVLHFSFNCLELKLVEDRGQYFHFGWIACP